MNLILLIASVNYLWKREYSIKCFTFFRNIFFLNSISLLSIEYVIFLFTIRMLLVYESISKANTFTNPRKLKHNKANNSKQEQTEFNIIKTNAQR